MSPSNTGPQMYKYNLYLARKSHRDQNLFYKKSVNLCQVKPQQKEFFFPPTNKKLKKKKKTLHFHAQKTNQFNTDSVQ